MVLALKNIQISFTYARREQFQLLSGVNLGVTEGEITALIGGNGTGKTTLFNIISGFQKGYSGQVFFTGQDISQMAPYQISRLGIGRLFQGRQLMENLSILENMLLASSDRSGEFPFSFVFRPRVLKERESKKKQQAVFILETLFGNNCKYIDMLDQPASRLSYGEQRMIAIARLLMGRNKLLLLDEPTSGVNAIYNEMIAEILSRMVEEEHLTVLLIEHNMHFVRGVASKCAFLGDGIISVYGNTDTVIDNPAVRSSYLGI